ncbi:MAG TPA: hypothetical protein VLV32_00120 [Burkholderiales bacterium]|nr:hypothetical protein [Burkholderiales bacterium]
MDVERRVVADRRTVTVPGVTGYDRRKWNRRGLPGEAPMVASGARKEPAEPQAYDLDFTVPKRKQ